MDNMTRRERLIAANKALMQKANVAKTRIEELSNRRGSQYEGGMANGAESIGTGLEFDEEESTEFLLRYLRATEELLGVSVMHYSNIELPPKDTLPAGRWNEITMNLIVLGTLKAAVTVIQGQQAGEHQVLSVECAVVDPLAQIELANFLAECCAAPPDSSLLLRGLKEYAQRSNDRKSVTKTFRNQHTDFVVKHITENGVLLHWKNIFQMSWSVHWNEELRKIQDDITLEIDTKMHQGFIRDCEASLVKLTDSSASAEDRLLSLNAIAAKAVYL